MMQRNKQIKRGVGLLVCKTFLEQPDEKFNTPIHLNGELIDCRLDNLLWRPRWFAISHAYQFTGAVVHDYPIREIETGERLTVWGAVRKYGLLCTDVLAALTNKTYVFPTMQVFEWDH
jgi:hypothetical protein